MRDLTGCFHLDRQSLELLQPGDFQAQEQNLQIAIAGEVKTPGGVNQTGEIAALYARHGSGLTEYAGGLYLLLIWDEKNGVFTIFQDLMTSPLNLMYTRIGQDVYFSTSLKKLIPRIPAPRRFAPGQVDAFLLNGYLIGEETLMEGVFKIKHHHALELREGRVEQIPVRYTMPEMNRRKAKSAFKPVLDRAIEACVKETDASTISSGYDSNYILHIAEKKDRPMRCYTVGADSGPSELDSVRENMKLYPSVRLVAASTGADSLQRLPDIVWRLEGCVYQHGVFLQYELARTAAGEGEKRMILGECADQVMHIGFMDPKLMEPQRVEQFRLTSYPYLAGSQLIFKKNGMMLHSFGIDGLYPYLDDEFVKVAHALREDNGTGKLFHKKNCERCLPAEILRNISKIGGSTDCHSLFQESSESKKAAKAVRESDFYRQHLKVNRSVTDTFRIMAIRNYLGNIKRSLRHPRKLPANAKLFSYKLHEAELRQVFMNLYLMVFERLYLSGDYDGRMDEAGCSLRLEELVKW